jgi:serine/threonine protein kinase
MRLVCVRWYGSVYMVMEYMEHDLKALMRSMKQPFRQSEVKCLLKQLLLATDAMYYLSASAFLSSSAFTHTPSLRSVQAPALDRASVC